MKHLTKAVVLTAVCVPAGASQAALYDFNGVTTLCTGTCDSFRAFDIGTTVNGVYQINTAPSGSWSFADVMAFSLEIMNPGAPLEPFNGTNPTTANPLPLTASIAPLAASGGGQATGGTTDVANELNNGTLLHEYIISPFNNNGAWWVTDLGAGGDVRAELCLFFPTAGCIPGATQAMVVDGALLRIPSSLAGDADGDFDVDLSDFNILAANFGLGPGAPGGFFIGDFDEDGEVDLQDFNLLAANFGLGTETVGALPEPGVGLMMALCVGGLTLQRRRRHRATTTPYTGARI